MKMKTPIKHIVQLNLLKRCFEKESMSTLKTVENEKTAFAGKISVEELAFSENGDQKLGIKIE